MYCPLADARRFRCENGDLRLDHRGILITGASQGLGKAIAQACLEEGAAIAICARDPRGLAETAALLSRDAPGRVHWLEADVADPAAVDRLAAFAAARLPDFCGLVNNAGMWGPKGAVEEVDPGDWRQAIEVNLFGVFHACRSVVPLFRERGYGKIVNLSGGGATSPMPRLSAYAASKAAVVRFTETLALEVRDANIDVNALAPGALNTKMLDEILAAGPDKVGAYYQTAMKQKESGGSSLERAAELCVRLLAAETDGVSGKLISAVWDPWERLAERREELRATDVYTLRRIVPADRGFDWDKP
jgi:NAD(P)-dependent dehydrogenase (short-subunit alcohol dehydrogenase family)